MTAAIIGWAHTPFERVYTHVAPALLLSLEPPTRAVFPSAPGANRPRVIALVATSVRMS